MSTTQGESIQMDTTEAEFSRRVAALVTEDSPDVRAQRIRVLEQVCESQKTLLEAKVQKLKVKPGMVVVFKVKQEDFESVDPRVVGAIKEAIQNVAKGPVCLLVFPKDMSIATVSVEQRAQLIETINQLPVG